MSGFPSFLILLWRAVLQAVPVETILQQVLILAFPNVSTLLLLIMAFCLFFNQDSEKDPIEYIQNIVAIMLVIENTKWLHVVGFVQYV